MYMTVQIIPSEREQGPYQYIKMTALLFLFPILLKIKIPHLGLCLETNMANLPYMMFRRLLLLLMCFTGKTHLLFSTFPNYFRYHLA